MDIADEDFWKLVSLGWDGKENIDSFLYREYGVWFVELDKEIFFGYRKGTSSYTHSVKVKSKKRAISYCLRVFRTINGEVVGPDPELMIKEDQEWT